MNKFVLVLSVVALLSACGEKSEQTTAPTEAPKAAQQVAASVAIPAQSNDKAALVAQAQGAVQVLSSTLKRELEVAMKTGGPVAAISLCHTKAPKIAEAIGIENGMEISRISLKNRNPLMGVPNDWQTTVLKDFEAKQSAGEDLATMTYAEVVGKEFRFMKAIPTSAVCLTCHGTELSPKITAKLTELYPHDKATGYKEGDLRGAFVVIKQLTQ